MIGNKKRSKQIKVSQSFLIETTFSQSFLAETTVSQSFLAETTASHSFSAWLGRPGLVLCSCAALAVGGWVSCSAAALLWLCLCRRVCRGRVVLWPFFAAAVPPCLVVCVPDQFWCCFVSPHFCNKPMTWRYPVIMHSKKFKNES